MLDGGPLRGTATLLTGPAGAGKSTLVTRYMLAAAERGERSVIYAFDERASTLLLRSAKLGMDIRPHLASGRIVLRQIDPAEMSPGAFTQLVRNEVEGEDPARLVAIDSLDGYLLAMPEDNHLMLHLHELLSYLNQRGVATFLLNPQQGLVGTMQARINLSYIADAIVLFRFFEAGGRVRKALSVIKNRAGAHEDTIRELRIEEGLGIRVGSPLTQFHGVLTGTPSYAGDQAPLLEERKDSLDA
jgi:circadian clock protein KaiC